MKSIVLKAHSEAAGETVSEVGVRPVRVFRSVKEVLKMPMYTVCELEVSHSAV